MLVSTNTYIHFINYNNYSHYIVGHHNKFASAGKQSSNSNSNSVVRDLFEKTKAVAKQTM